MTTLTIQLPDQLAKTAEELGLLNEHALISMFEDAIERQQGAIEFMTAADALAALHLPEMSAEEIQAEILEARSNRRADRP